MFRLAFRNLFRQTGRALMTLAGIVFGVVGMILAGGFVEEICFQLQEFTIHSQLGHIQVHKQGFSGLGQRDPYHYSIIDRKGLAASRLPVVEASRANI